MSKSVSPAAWGAIVSIYLLLRLCWLTVPSVFETLELRVQDNMLRLAHHMGISKDISPDIVFIDIDDKSIAENNLSPNDPELYARLVSILNGAGVTIQLVDIFFSTGGSGKATSNLEQNIADAASVYLPVIVNLSDNQAHHNTPLPRSAQWLQGMPDSGFPEGSGVHASITRLEQLAAGLGHINCWPDYDGVFRRIPLFMNTGEHLIPALSLCAAAGYLQVQPTNIEITGNNVVLNAARFPDGRTRDITIPRDPAGSNRINFIGPWPRMFAHYSVSTILETGATPKGLLKLRDELEGTLAIISDVSTGGRDYGPVPFSTYSPLSTIHAQFLNSILTNSFVREAGTGLELVQDSIIILVLFIIALRFRGTPLVLCGFLIIAVIITMHFYLFTFHRQIFPVVRPALFFASGTTVILLFQFLHIKQEKNIIKTRLSPYFAPSVMNKILESPDLLSTAVKKDLTILFSDIAGFTRWSSDKEANQIHQTLNRYFQEMSSIVFSYEGTVDKFMGDGMLAFFGDPSPHEDHVRRGVLSALAMQEEAKKLREEWAAVGGMDIRIRIGIHTGEVVVGDMGSTERMEYTVIGSNVNLAQRLESNSAPDKILVSKEVAEQLDRDFEVTACGRIEAKGFSTPIDVFWVESYHGPKRK